VLRYSPDLIKQEPISTSPAISHSNLNKPVHLDDSINHVRLLYIYCLYCILFVIILNNIKLMLITFFVGYIRNISNISKRNKIMFLRARDPQ
jgi:hypothetical protein